MKEKIVHAHIYDPRNSMWGSKKSDKAQCTTITCSNHEQCPLLKRGECALLPPILAGGECKYGRKRRESGYTSRARKYHSWISEKKEQYKDAPSLKSYNQKIAIVGDYVFLPYAHMNMNKNLPFDRQGGFMSSGSLFINLEDFTIDTIIKICDSMPEAFMGGAITSYREEVVPKFLIHLKEELPDIFEKLVSKYERAKSIVDNHSDVGREAILETINPNVGILMDIHGGEWTWDGEYLTCSNRAPSFMLVSKVEETRIKPKKGQYVKINSDDQVNDKTEFKE